MAMSLAPNQAAKIADAVYSLKDNNDLADVALVTGGLGVRGLFSVDNASHFSGTSGPLIFKNILSLKKVY